MIFKHSGKNIKCEIIPLEAIKNESFIPKNISEYAENAFIRLFFYYNRWGLTGNKNILRFLLGREPTSVEDYVIRSLKT